MRFQMSQLMNPSLVCICLEVRRRESVVVGGFEGGDDVAEGAGVVGCRAGASYGGGGAADVLERCYFPRGPRLRFVLVFWLNFING